MTITKRTDKGSALTFAEMDENIRDLREDTDLTRVLTNGNDTTLDIVTTGSVYAANGNIDQLLANNISTFTLSVDDELTVKKLTITDPEGEGLNQVYHKVFARELMGAGGTGTSVDVTIPSEASVGDLSILSVWTDDTASPNHQNPTGWTYIGDTSANGTPVQGKMWYKIIESGDAGSTVTVNWTGDDIYSYLINVFEGDAPITSVDNVRNFTSARDSVAISISLSESNVNTNRDAVTIAYVNLSGRNAQTPVMTWPEATSNMHIGHGFLSEAGGDAPDFGFIGYPKKIKPMSKTGSQTISTDDPGQQALMGVFIEVS